MATGRSSLRVLLQTAPAISSHAAASVLAATSDAAVSAALRPASAATATRALTSATRPSSSAAAAAAAPGSSGSTAAPRWSFRTVLPGFECDSPASTPVTARASMTARASTTARAYTSVTGSSSSTAASAAPGSSGSTTATSTATAAARAFTSTVAPGFGRDSLAPTPAIARATSTARTSTSAWGSSANTTAASLGSWASTTGTAQARSACPTLIHTTVSRFGSGSRFLAPATWPYGSASSRISGYRFSSSTANAESGSADGSSTEGEDPADRSSAENKDLPTDAYFIVIGDVLKNVSFSEAELRYLSDILATRLKKYAKHADTSLSEEVDRIAKVQDKQAEKIDKLVNAKPPEQKLDKPEWFTVNVFGRPLDLPKIGSFFLRIFTSGGS